MTKQEKLRVLKKEMEMAKLPLKGKANLVFGEGNPDCDVLFIGEAPGFMEDTQKRPFVGKAGIVLDRLIREVSWERKNVYVTNIVKRRPPENRDPTTEEIEAYKPFLAKQIEIINPKIIATLGRFSMNYFLPDAKISNDHGKPSLHEGRQIFPLFHPAAAMRATYVMDDLRFDFKKLAKFVKEKAVAEANALNPVAKKPEKPAQANLF